MVSHINWHKAFNNGLFSYWRIIKRVSLFFNFYSNFLDSKFCNFIWIFIPMRGSIIWKAQRYSSVLILVYLIYILSFIVSNDEINFFSWSNFFLSFEVRFLTSIVFIIIVMHAFIGLWTVGTDYLTHRTLGFLNKSLSKRANLLRNTYFLIFGSLGLVYLISILYIIWL